MTEKYEQLDHTPAHLTHAMSGLRFGAKALLEGVRQTEVENGNPDDERWEKILRRAEQAFMQVIQDHRYMLRNGNGFIGAYGGTPPFPLLIRNESIEVEFSPDPALVEDGTRTMPRPVLEGWQNLFENKRYKEKETGQESPVAEDDFSGLDFMDTLMVPTVEPADSAEKTLADHGDMRVMEPVETTVPDDEEFTPLIHQDKLNSLLYKMEHTHTLTVPNSPMIAVKEEGDSLTDVIKLCVSEGEFTARPGGTYVPKDSTPKPLNLDMEVFDRLFPDRSSKQPKNR